MQIVNIQGEVREGRGKSFNKALRKEGKVPAVIYGGNKNIHFTTGAKELKPIIYTPDFKLAEISIDGSNHKAILKDIQFHPVTDEIVHVDFQELVENRKVNVSVPVRFTGASPGVKNGGKLIQSLRKVKVKVDPEHIVDELIADISELELNSAIRVRDLVVGEGIQVLVNGATPLASVEVPRVLKSAEAGEGLEGLEGLEGEESEGGEGEGDGKESSEGREE